MNIQSDTKGQNIKVQSLWLNHQITISEQQSEDSYLLFDFPSFRFRCTDWEIRMVYVGSVESHLAIAAASTFSALLNFEASSNVCFFMWLSR